MTSNYFQQYFTGYTVTNFRCYPIRRHIIKASALEFTMTILSLSFQNQLLDPMLDKNNLNEQVIGFWYQWHLSIFIL